MTRISFGHAAVSLLGLLLGAVFAICIAQGDVLLPIVAAITLAVFVHDVAGGLELRKPPPCTGPGARQRAGVATARGRR